MSVKADKVNMIVEIKDLDPLEFKRLYDTFIKIRKSIWTQPTENYTITVQGDKVKV